MCGILVANKNSPEKILVDLMSYLDDQRGGDGMGVSYFPTPNVKIIKGVKLDPDDCVKAIKESKKLLNSMFLFHTRKTSKGFTNEFNVQPFPLSRNTAICHNGTWHDYERWARLLYFQGLITPENLNNMSDTQIIVRMIQWRNMDFLGHVVNNGVWIKYTKNETRLYAFGERTFEAAKIDGRWYYASQFKEVHEEHYEFQPNTTALLNPNGFKVLHGKVEVKKNIQIFSKDSTCRHFPTNKKKEQKIPTNGYKLKHDGLVILFDTKGKQVLQFVEETGEVLEENSKKKLIDIPKEVEKQRNMLSVKEIKMVTKWKNEHPKEEKIPIVKNKADLNIGSITGWDFWTHILNDEQIEKYIELTFNIFSPDDDEKIVLEHSGTYLSEGIKHAIASQLKREKTVEEVRNWFIAFWGEQLIPVQWQNADQVIIKK